MVFMRNEYPYFNLAPFLERNIPFFQNSFFQGLFSYLILGAIDKFIVFTILFLLGNHLFALFVALI